VTEVGACHHVVADPVDLQTVDAAQLRLHEVGQAPFLSAHRRDRYQLRGPFEQIDHPERLEPRPDTTTVTS
jgi:hypothetical protein